MTIQDILVGNQHFTVTGNGYDPTGTFNLDQKPIDPADYPELSQLLKMGFLANDALVFKEPESNKAWRKKHQLPIL